jgi:hypothetical protein
MIVFLLLFINTFTICDDHALYISVAEVNIADDLVDIELKVFTDDLYNALKNWNPELKSTHSDLAMIEVQGYFNQYFKLSNGQQSILLTSQKIESNGDAHFIHFKGILIDALAPLTINASYFFELFPTQQNILKVKKGDHQSFYTLKLNKAEAVIK